MYPTNTIGYIVLRCNRFTTLFTQRTHKKQTQKIKLLILQDSTLKVLQLAYRGWHRVSKQGELLTGGRKGGGKWWSWRMVLKGTYYSISKVHPCCGMYQLSHSFLWLNNLPLNGYILHFLYPCISWWTLGCFYFLSIMNNAINTRVQGFVDLCS